MEEILKDINNAIEDIKKQKDELEQLEINSREKREELEKLKDERKTIEDKESGFYKDLSEEIQKKDSEFREADSQRRMKDKAIDDEVKDKKEKIIEQLKAKRQYIDDNRNVDINDIDIEALKEEKEKLEKEIALNDTTKEEFLKMSDSEKMEVKKAKENYLNNKHRLDEINPKIELMETLDGKNQKDKFMDISNLEKMIEEKFNKKDIDNIHIDLGKEEDNHEKDWYDEEGFEKALEEAQEKKKETEEFAKLPKDEFIKKYKETSEKTETDKDKYNLEKLINKMSSNIEASKGEDKKIESIFISEKEGRIYIKAEGKIIEEASIDKALKMKRQNYKRLNVDDICKEVTDNWLSAKILKSKINPEIVAALQKDKEMLRNYIENTYNEKKYPFDLTHDLTGNRKNIFNKMRMNLYAREERKSGAKVIGTFWDKNNTIEEGSIKKNANAVTEYNKKMNKEENSKEDIKERVKVDNVNNKIETKALDEIASKEETERARVVNEVLSKENKNQGREEKEM